MGRLRIHPFSRDTVLVHGPFNDTVHYGGDRPDRVVHFLTDAIFVRDVARPLGWLLATDLCVHAVPIDAPFMAGGAAVFGW